MDAQSQAANSVAATGSVSATRSDSGLPPIRRFRNLREAKRAARMLHSEGQYVSVGSAATGLVGPIGAMDVGECKDAYIFRISLPGVKRDESDFSCEVGTDGKVVIRGVTTTGERTVCKFSEVFQMKSNNLCPPGQFSLTFQLPGPVNPQQFTGNFGSGILEGIVMKRDVQIDN